MVKRGYSPPTKEDSDEAISDMVTELYTLVRDMVRGDSTARDEARQLCRKILFRLGGGE